MANDIDTGLLTASSLPAGQRAYYEARLLENLRTKSILVPFTVMKEDFKARDTGQVVYTEVLDPASNWNPFTEDVIWLGGAHLDSRSVTINLEIHGNVIKLSDYNELVNYWNNGDLRGLVDGKLGFNMVEHIDILARNAFMSHPHKLYAGTATSRGALAKTDIFNPDMAELARVHLEENEVPGVNAPGDGDGKWIVCVTTPRVVHDIRTAAGSEWLDTTKYTTQRKFNSEAGSWGGVRFVKTNRCRMLNYGAVTAQNTLASATVPGQGAAQTVDGAYTVGQATSVRTIPLVSAIDVSFAVGAYVTFHSQLLGAGGTPPIESDGTQETYRIVAVDSVGKTISLNKPLMKAHAIGDYVTTGVPIHVSIFMGGPGVVYGVGERPHPVILPVIDDLGMIRRIAWRGFVKMQLFRPEMYEVVESSGTSN